MSNAFKKKKEGKYSVIFLIIILLFPRLFVFEYQTQDFEQPVTHKMLQ